MLEQLKVLDQSIFILINSIWNNDFLDFVLPLARNKFLWIPLYLFLASFLVLNFKWKGLIVALYMVGTIVISDQLSSTLIKPIIERVRPCNDTSFNQYVTLRLPHCGGGKSMPSSHATNHFAIAIFCGLVFFRFNRLILPFAFCWALLISYAQVYVGVHYPFDVIAGALIGILIGITTAIICKRQVNLFNFQANINHQ